MPPTTPRHPAWATAKRPVGDTAMTGVQSAKRGIGGVNGDDFGAVHLVGHDDRNAFAVKRLHGKAAVLHDMIEVVLHVGTEVQRRERPLA